MIRLILPTLAFYVVAISSVMLLSKVSPSGPCTPGLGALSGLLLIPLSVGLLVKNIRLSVTKGRRNLVVVAIHAIVIILGYLLMW